MSESLESFEQLGLTGPILKALSDVGYESPTPIQARCIPVLLEGHDLIGQAQTGTGKTAAFALPILQKIELSLAQPQALILTPTRELTIQIAEAFQKYAHYLPGFHVLPIYGGQGYGSQFKHLARGAHVVVGTPGRIMDHLERATLNLSHLKTLVLDEGDEMLRMGFIDDVEWILEHTPEAHQTALFSATMPEPIRRVAQRYLQDPQELKIKAATATVAAIKQSYWLVSGIHKLDALTRILEVEDELEAALIFVRTKTATVELAEKLAARGYPAAALNGDLSQAQRESTIEQLRSGALDIVIATDVAARGIDVPRITHVINYDIPYDTEGYVHRIGRTGRAGRAGHAILFVAPREMRMLRVIERATRQPIASLALPTRQHVTDKRVSLFKQKVGKILEAGGLEFFANVVGQLEEEQNVPIHELAAALAYMAQGRKPLQLEGEDPPPPRAERDPEARRRRMEEREGASGEERDERTRRPGAMVRYRLDVGHMHGVQVRDIVGAITNESGLSNRMMGKILLYEDSSTIEMPVGMPRDILLALKRVRVCGVPINMRPDGAGGEERYRGPAPRRARLDRPDRGEEVQPEAGVVRRRPPRFEASEGRSQAGSEGGSEERPVERPFARRRTEGSGAAEGQGAAERPVKRRVKKESSEGDGW